MSGYHSVFGRSKENHQVGEYLANIGGALGTLEIARFQAIAAAVLFSTGGAGIKVAAFSGPQVAAMRSTMAAVALLIWLRGRLKWSVSAVGIGVIYACMITLFVNATKLTTAANAIFLQSTAPLYILLLAPAVIGERFHPRDLAYLGAVAVGMVLCFIGQPSATATAPDPATGNVLAVLCGVTWALTLLLLRRVERAPTSTEQIVAAPVSAPVAVIGARRRRAPRAPEPGVGVTAVVIGNLIAGAGSLPFAWPLPAATMAEWATLIYLGVFQIGLAYVCLTAALRHLPALEASLLLLLEPALNPVWTWLVRGERPGGWVITGGSIILAATALKSVFDARGEHIGDS